MSPGLFNLFISDFNEYLRKKGSQVVSFNGTAGLVILMNADDLMIRADLAVNMNKCEIYLY